MPKRLRQRIRTRLRLFRDIPAPMLLTAGALLSGTIGIALTTVAILAAKWRLPATLAALAVECAGLTVLLIVLALVAVRHADTPTVVQV